MKLIKDYHLRIIANSVLSILLSLVITSCATVKSGHYVQLSPGESMEAVAKRFKIKVSVLKRHNRHTRKGWVFIPSKIGLLPRLNEFYYFKDYEPGQFIWPVPGSKRISSYYGYRKGRPHDGIDIAAPRGMHIVSSAEGKVVYAGNTIRGYGNMIVVKHDDDYFTVYAHNRKNFVSKGDKVHQGQVIAQVGNTGRSTGPHLHFEVRKKERKLNPIAFIGHEVNKTAKK